MALPINIEELIKMRTVESSRIEFKKDWNSEKVLHTITAFANDIDNSGGGYIIIGVEEEFGMPKFPLLGIEKNQIDKIDNELLSLCNLIEPRYIPYAEPFTIDGKIIFVIWVPGGNDRPYKAPLSLGNKKPDKKIYIRKLSSTIRANNSEEKELYMLSETIPFDDRVNVNGNISDLKMGLIQNYLNEVRRDLVLNMFSRPIEDIAEDMHLLSGPKENRRPCNVALLFFNDRPDNFFPYTRIDCVIKNDPTGQGMIEKIFYGPVNFQLKNALSFIRENVIKQVVYKRSDRAEAERYFNYPYAALEEALTNAIYHKSYQIGQPVTVEVTRNQIEIISIPGPDASITDEDIKSKHIVSRYNRNRRIGDFLKELKLAEGRNTGIPTILKAMEDNLSPSPIFLTDKNRTFFSVILPVNEHFLEKKEEKIKTKKRTKGEIKELVVLELKEKGPICQKELSILLGYAKPTENFHIAIKELMNEKRGTSRTDPFQKIRLTS